MTTAKEFHNQILTRAAEDDEFRARLVNDPTSAIESELGVNVPGNVTVHVHQDSQAEVNLVLPPKKHLTEEEMANVAGGQWPWGY